MARKFAEELKVDLAIVDKRRVSAEQVEASALIGDVKGKNVILVDDICSTGTTLIAAAKVCKRNGAKSVRAFVSHGLFVGKDLDGLDGVYCTDSVPGNSAMKGSNVTVVSAAELFGQAIERLLSAQSISSLFIS